MISIIIPTYKRTDYLKDCLGSIIRQRAKDFEILVISDGYHPSTDALMKNYSKYKNIRYFKQQNSGPAVARNKGLKSAAGDIIVFLDDDCIVGADWIDKIAQAHARYPEISAIAGSIIAVVIAILIVVRAKKSKT